MSLRTIRLELARNPGWPHGNSDRGYEFKAPLSDDGHIDVEGWRATISPPNYAAPTRAGGRSARRFSRRPRARARICW